MNWKDELWKKKQNKTGKNKKKEESNLVTKIPTVDLTGEENVWEKRWAFERNGELCVCERNCDEKSRRIHRNEGVRKRLAVVN